MDDLVNRLTLWGEHGLTSDLSDLTEAAARITALEADKAGLVEVVRLYVDLSDVRPEHEDIVARAALEQHGGSHDQ